MDKKFVIIYLFVQQIVLDCYSIPQTVLDSLHAQNTHTALDFKRKLDHITKYSKYNGK